MVTRSGNYLVDRLEDEMDRTHECCECRGSGNMPWNKERYSENLQLGVYALEKMGTPITNFKELMRYARGLKSVGQRCDNCNGSGEVSR